MKAFEIINRITVTMRLQKSYHGLDFASLASLRESLFPSLSAHYHFHPPQPGIPRFILQSKVGALIGPQSTGA
jgi:hypothetical protein